MALLNIFRLMPSPIKARRAPAIAAILLAGCQWLGAQNAFSPGGTNYPISGPLPGDQTLSQAAIHAAGGLVVWQDNGADGNGLGVRAVRLGAGLSPTGNSFLVNTTTVGDQERPQVAALSGGRSVVVWQGGRLGFQKVFARYVNADGTFSSGEILVNTYTNQQQTTPAVAALSDGNVIVVWASDGQDGSRKGVFAQRLGPNGAKLGNEFQVNQFTPNNQRSPVVAALANGGFVVAWISELQRSSASVDVYARLFDNSGNASGNAFVVNPSSASLCSSPSVAASPIGGFAVAWNQRDDTARNTSGEFQVTESSPNGWDVYARIFASSGVASTPPVRLNTATYGDQYNPKLNAFGKNYLCVWTSMGQDGSREGIFGQFVNNAGVLEGVEFLINTTTLNRQIHPSVATDGANQFLVTWSSFVGDSSFDIFARNYELIRVETTAVPVGLNLTWNTRAGSVYQVQSAANCSTWTNLGNERTAASTSDNVTINTAAVAGCFRVIRVR